MRSRKAGIALVTVLIMTSVLLMMVLALYISSRGGLFSTMNHQRRLKALYVAEAGLADTMEALEGAGFGPVGSLTGTLPDGGTWQVNFNDTGPPYTDMESVNNLTVGGAAESYRGLNSVPPYSALVVVRARVGGVDRVLEAIVSRGTAPVNVTNAMQGTGNVLMIGDVAVDGIKALNDNTPVPGRIHSNASSGVAIKWDDQAGTATANITGSVSASGSSTIDLASATPGGGIQTGQAPAPFPAVDVVGTIASNSSAPAPVLNMTGTTTLAAGDYYYNGDMNLTGGDLSLNGANLYVTGDLTVNGSISGDGSVYAGGQTTLMGDANVNGMRDQNVALFSHGSVTLQGFDGTAWLEANAATDPTLASYYNQTQTTLQAMQTLMNSNPTSALVSGGAAYNQLELYRRTLGQFDGAAWSGVPNQDLFYLMQQHLATNYGSSTGRDFLIQKFDSLNRLYDGRKSNNFEPGCPGSIATWVSDWQNNTYAVYGGWMDGIGDGGYTAEMNEVINITNAIDYDKLGSSYFQGLVYTNGYLYADNEVGVLGAVIVNGDPTLPTNIINGNTVKPGDIYLGNGTQVTFVEDFFSTPMGGPGNTASVETWIGR
ncbi:MAG: pilus assembly PilX N-terminal domain-containing protein [Candidatus Eremiobacterota bacterium]